jgi:hypothetical protein
MTLRERADRVRRDWNMDTDQSLTDLVEQAMLETALLTFQSVERAVIESMQEKDKKPI